MPHDAPESNRERRASSVERRDPYALSRLTWQEVAAHLERDSRLIFPIGALEQHGPHLPLGTNTLISESLAIDLSRDLRILRAPTLQYGVGFPGQRGYAGSANLRRKTLHRAVNELLGAWEDHGVMESIVITAHRYEMHLDALLMALTSRATTTVISLSSIETGDLLSGPPELETGGELETSLLLFLEPDRVRHSKISDYVPDQKTHRRYVRGQGPTPPGASQGCIGYPSRATKEKGRRIYQRYLDTIKDCLL